MLARLHHATRDVECACYLTESSLAHDLVSELLSGDLEHEFVQVATEFDFSSGRTDVLGKTVKGEIFAFEAKLSDWKTALNQARRGESFAHFSFVVLPERSGDGPLKNRELFERFGVGLVLLNGISFRVAIPARRKKPLLPWLTKAAEKYLVDEQPNAA